MLTRRGLIGSLLAAPAIIRPGVLMPIKPALMVPHVPFENLLLKHLREQDAWRENMLAAWAADFNLSRLPADPRWRTSLA